MSKTTQQTHKSATPRPAIIQREEETVARQAQTPIVNAQNITPQQVPYLQSAIGNRAVVQLLRDWQAGQSQRTPTADIQRNFPHGATAAPLLPNQDQKGGEALEQLQRVPEDAIQRDEFEEEEEESQG